MIGFITGNPKTNFVKVGDTLFFPKKGGITVGERRQLAETDASRQQAALKIQRLIRKIAQQRGISLEDAQKLLVGGVENGVEVVESTEIVLEYAEDLSEINAYTSSMELNLKAVVATMLIKERVAHVVTIVADANKDDKKLTIEALPADFLLEKGTKIRIGENYENSFFVTVEDNYGENTEQIRVSALPKNISAGTFGFLHRGKIPLLGYPSWNLEKTYLLDESLVYEIYDFYFGETTRWEKIENSETQGEQLESRKFPELTGKDSTGESNPTE